MGVRSTPVSPSTSASVVAAARTSSAAVLWGGLPWTKSREDIRSTPTRPPLPQALRPAPVYPEAFISRSGNRCHGPRARRPSRTTWAVGGAGSVGNELGVLVPRHPRPPATTPHQGGHPGEEGPGRQPQEEGQPGRPSGHFRRRALPQAQHRRATDQQAEGPAWHHHTLRQDARELPRRPRTPCLDDADRRSLASSRLITTSHRPRCAVPQRW
jgi:hypothetical protein